MGNYLGSLAATTYNQSSSGGSDNKLLPRSRWDFKTIIYHNGSSVPSPLVIERISEIQLPGSILRTTTLNQYNRKRIANIGVEYTPIYINAYDTRDAEVEKFLAEYMAYYYNGGPMNSDGSIETNYSDIITENFSTNGSQKGLNMVDKKYFIEKIEIERGLNSEAQDPQNVITVYSPMITGVSGDTLNYSESSMAQMRIEIAYEGYDVTSK
jgi:hypothetical protein